MGAENTAKTRKSRMRLNIIDFLIIIVLIGAVVGIAILRAREGDESGRDDQGENILRYAT
ncbi:MAG: hypothetical protein ACLR5G_13405 [Eubacteriales bacterium]